MADKCKVCGVVPNPQGKCTCPDGPQDDNTRAALRKLGMMVDNELPQGWGFFLMAFPLGDRQGRCNYTSNGDRRDVLKVMKNFIARSEENPHAWMKHSPDKI